MGEIVWKLAEFLAWHGLRDVWETLWHSFHHAPHARFAPPLGLFEDQLFQALRGHDYLLCLDDVHHIKVDPQYNGLIDRLGKAVRAGEIRLIITAQQAVEIEREVEFQPLTGLNLNDTRLLLSDQGLTLTEPQLEELHQKTDGNPQLLTLARDLLQKSQDKAQVIRALIQAEQVEQFLLRAVDDHLQEPERLVMNAAAALLGWPGTAEALEEMLDGAEVNRTLLLLCNRYLLYKLQRQGKPEYNQHASLQAFYYNLLNRRRRQELHRRAAVYYEREEGDVFKAALHYRHAGDLEQAARLAILDIRKQLYTGKAVTLLNLLDDLPLARLPQPLGAQVSLAKGELSTYLQQVPRAQAAYQATLDQLAPLPPSSQVRALQVQTYRGLGFLLKGTEPAAALAWLQKGLATADKDHVNQIADLQIQSGDAYLRLGNYPASLENLTQGLDLLSAEPSHLRLLALMNLGIYHYYQNALQQCQAYFAQALQMAEQIEDPFNRLEMTVNLANLKQTTGDWTAAQEHYQHAAELADKLGDQEEIANIALNWGALYLHQGALEQAATQLATAIAQGRQCELHDLVILGLTYWAELQLLQNELETAQTALSEAEALMTQHEIAFTAPFVYTTQARYFLAVADHAQAQTYADRARESARAQGMGQEEGQALRVLGEVQLALQQPHAAIESCQESLILLEAISYEAARTQVVMGQAWVAVGDTQQSKQLLQTARSTLGRLGAQRDWAEVKALIEHRNRAPGVIKRTTVC